MCEKIIVYTGEEEEDDDDEEMKDVVEVKERVIVEFLFYLFFVSVILYSSFLFLSCIRTND